MSVSTSEGTAGMTMAQRLRALLAEHKPLLAAGVFDAISARIAEDEGRHVHRV